MKYEITTINGKKYIEEKVIKEFQEKIAILKGDLEKKSNSPKLKEFNIHEVDSADVMGIGSGEVTDGWIGVKISINYLERALKIIKTLNDEGKKNSTSVTLAWTNDQPVIIGNFQDSFNVKKQSKKWSGVILAPRSDIE